MTDEDKAKKKPRVVVPVRMSEEGRDAIDAMAAELGMAGGRSEFIRIAAQEKLARHLAEKKRTP